MLNLCKNPFTINTLFTSVPSLTITLIKPDPRRALRSSGGGLNPWPLPLPHHHRALYGIYISLVSGVIKLPSIALLMRRSGPCFLRWDFLSYRTPTPVAGRLPIWPCRTSLPFCNFHRGNAACDARGCRATIGINIWTQGSVAAIHYTPAPPSWLYSDIWLQSYH